MGEGIGRTNVAVPLHSLIRVNDGLITSGLGRKYLGEATFKWLLSELS